VDGAVYGFGNWFESFELTGLGTGDYSLIVSDEVFFVFNGDTIGVVSIGWGGGSAMLSPTTVHNAVTLSFGPSAIPADGDIVFFVSSSFDPTTNSYEVEVATTLSPEPGTILSVGLGLAMAALALGRKRRKQ